LEFILVTVPMLLMSLTVVGLAINGFAKNIAQDVAVEAARFAALADQGVPAARERALQSLSRVLPKSWAPDVQVIRRSPTATCSYEATVTLKPLAIGFLLGIGTIRESAHAVCELQG
jgi:hypothetical protein